MEVWVPPGNLLGTIKQKTNLSTPLFNVYSKHGNLEFRIEGPPGQLKCITNGKDVHFKVEYF